MFRNPRAVVLLSLVVLPLAMAGCGNSNLPSSSATTAVGTKVPLSNPGQVDNSNGTGTKPGSSHHPSVKQGASSKSGNSSVTTSRRATGTQTNTVKSVTTTGKPVSKGAASASTAVEKFQADNVDVTFHPNAWKGLGTAALIITPPTGSGYLKQLLYVIDDNAESSHGASGNKPTAVLLSDHAAATRLSPTGKYIAVLTSSSSGDSSTSVQNTLWLMAADGSSKQKLTTDIYSLVGDWLPHSNTFVYADDQGNLYSVTPGMPPKKLAVSLDSGETIDAVVANPQNDSVALNVVVSGGGSNPAQRYDKLMLWNTSSGKLTTLDQTNAPNGFDLGPWTNDGKKIFYWLDPDHSGSIAADGLSLYEAGNGSHRVQIATSLTGLTVIPVGAEQAVIQSGRSRFLYDKKTIQLWSGKNLTTLTTRGQSSSITQFEPNLSPDGTTVSFVEAPVLSNGVTSGQGMYDWWNSLQIVTANLQTGTEHLLSAAGHGVSAPHFSPGGQRIFFLKGNQLDVTRADNTVSVTPVFTVDTSTQPYGGQWGFQVPLDISDYAR